MNDGIKKVELLPTNFVGKGEVKGFVFELERAAPELGVYLYIVMSEWDKYYEVFKAKEVPILIDFEKREYSTTHFKHTYPKANKFGISAFTTHDLEKAKEYFYNFQK